MTFLAVTVIAGCIILWPIVAIEKLRRHFAFQRWLMKQPLRSTKADSKRFWLKKAEQAYGHPVSWKKARKYANEQLRLQQETAA